MISAPFAHAGRSQAAVSGSGLPVLSAEEPFGLDGISGCFLSPAPVTASRVPALSAGPALPAVSALIAGLALPAVRAASAGLLKDIPVFPVEPELLFVRPVA